MEHSKMVTYFRQIVLKTQNSTVGFLQMLWNAIVELPQVKKNIGP